MSVREKHWCEKGNTLLGLLKIPLDDILVRNTGVLGELDGTATTSSELPQINIDRNEIWMQTYSSDNEHLGRSAGLLDSSL